MTYAFFAKPSIKSQERSVFDPSASPLSPKDPYNRLQKGADRWRFAYGALHMP